MMNVLAMPHNTSSLLFLSLAFSCAALGCGDSADDGGAASVDAGGTGENPDAAGGGGDGDGGLSAEVCNGIDDDGNGFVDDIDVGGDGICDCLLIATIGIAGTWGEGEVFADWVMGKSDNGTTHLTPAGQDPELTVALLAPYHVIVVQDASVLDAFSQAEIDAVNGWVNAGGGLMTLIGYGDATERVNVNSLLAPMGLSYGDAQILGGSPTVPVDDTWATHPIAEEVTSIGMDNGYPVVDSGGGLVIAEEQGQVIGVAKAVGLGKVFVWGDEWITYNSEWVDPRYQVERFWLNSINWLTPQEQCEIDVID